MALVLYDRAPAVGVWSIGRGPLYVRPNPVFCRLMAARGVPSGTCNSPESSFGLDLETVAGSVDSSLEALTSQVASMLIPGQHPPTQHPDKHAGQTLDLAGLSKRQLEILGLLAEGKTNTEIADALSRSPNTVKLHVSAILRHLHVKSRTQAALLAARLLHPELQA